MNKPGQNVTKTQVCYFDELHIRARSPWHREQYNQHLEAGKLSGLSTDEARARAIETMQAVMGESSGRRASQ